LALREQLAGRVRAIRAEVARTKRRAGHAKNNKVKQELLRSARATNRDGNRLNRERQRVENSLNNLFSEQLGRFYMTPSPRRLPTPKSGRVSTPGVQRLIGLRRQLKTAKTPSRVRHLKMMTGAGTPARKPLFTKPPNTTSKNINSNNNNRESQGNKNNNK
jgi:hypothetical protein